MKKPQLLRGCFNINTTARRLELLKKEGQGFNKTEIVKDLAQKFGVTCNTIWRDFRLRNQWQLELQELKNSGQIILTIINNYKQIYRDAFFIRRTTKNDNVQIGALKVMMESTEKLFETAVLPEVMNRISTLENMVPRRG